MPAEDGDKGRLHILPLVLGHHQVIVLRAVPCVNPDLPNFCSCSHD